MISIIMIRENTGITDRNVYLIFITFWNERRRLEQINLVIMDMRFVSTMNDSGRLHCRLITIIL